MNEVTQIHLGNQAYTIATDAHKNLRNYLDAINKEVRDAEVIEEIEIRMAELLAERGIKNDKVVLLKDVDYLKKQLGSPTDFKNDAELAGDSPEAKKLFRDTDNAVIAGVAAGLANYFGVEALLIRIIFIIGTVAWGGGILIYIALWLLVPEAKSPSEKLLMQGKNVTINSLKDAVERADLKGAASRANGTLAGPINTLFRIIVKLVGIGLVVIGLGLLLGLLAVGLYLVFHGNFVMDSLFPIGFKEHMLVYVGFAVGSMISLFIILFGMAVFRRKWPVRAWLTGVLAGLTLIGLVAGTALAADAAPRIRDRYNANFQVQIRNVPAFSAINAVGQAVSVNVQPSDKYYVSLRYYKGADPSKVKTSVNNGILLIDYSQFKWDRHCPTFCLPNVYDMVITVYSPNLPKIDMPYGPGEVNIPKFGYQ